MGNCGSTDSHELLATNKRNNLVDWSTFSPLEVPMMSAKRDECSYKKCDKVSESEIQGDSASDCDSFDLSGQESGGDKEKAITEAVPGVESVHHQMEKLCTFIGNATMRLSDQVQSLCIGLEEATARIKTLENDVFELRKETKNAPDLCEKPGVATGNSSEIQWAGYNWIINDGPSGWSPKNVWVDYRNRLHLRLQYDSATEEWTGAQVYSVEKLGFGTYRWFVEGKIHDLDSNVHFSLVSSSRGHDLRDLRIEATGGPKKLLFAARPARKENELETHLFYNKLALWGSAPFSTTHSFHWSRNFINFLSQHDFVDGAGGWLIAKETTPRSFVSLVPDTPAQVVMELRVTNGKPVNGHAVEVIIAAFQFTPQ